MRLASHLLASIGVSVLFLSLIEGQVLTQGRKEAFKSIFHSAKKHAICPPTIYLEVSGKM